MNNAQQTCRLLANQVFKLTTKLDHVEDRYAGLRAVLKKVGQKKGTCWCAFATRIVVQNIIHTEECDAIFLALYGAKRGE